MRTGEADVRLLQRATGRGGSGPDEAVESARRLLRRFDGDPEKSFCAILPVGSPDGGANPGALYLLLRAHEERRFREREAEFLYGTVSALAAELGKHIGSIRWEVARKAESTAGDDSMARRQRLVAVDRVRQLQHALALWPERLAAMRRTASIDGLRGALFVLRRADKNLPVWWTRMRGTPMQPLEAWIARVQEIDEITTALRRGLEA